MKYTNIPTYNCPVGHCLCSPGLADDPTGLHDKPLEKISFGRDAIPNATQQYQITEGR